MGSVRVMRLGIITKAKTEVLYVHTQSTEHIPQRRAYFRRKRKELIVIYHELINRSNMWNLLLTLLLLSYSITLASSTKVTLPNWNFKYDSQGNVLDAHGNSEIIS